MVKFKDATVDELVEACGSMGLYVEHSEDKKITFMRCILAIRRAGYREAMESGQLVLFRVEG